MIIHACTACGHTVFPARKLCHRCGGGVWREVPCDRGVVAAVTSVQPDILLAEVRAHGLRVIARLRQAITPGGSVVLHEAEDGALWGSIDADQT